MSIAFYLSFMGIFAFIATTCAARADILWDDCYFRHARRWGAAAVLSFGAACFCSGAAFAGFQG
jgi:hypothetical protein